ncbi:serine hydrolase [Marilutibacter chinensis]|uniref:Serine hydrolase n=1 Tax=Marilutibacter chinensis TaxID=2912247 RepID=A0ABS9HVL3_9GAMM|nr:serine hydrolase [Lysobacter chinensis]MCF7222244.1 serine hydrolase [Lysobacter chinensis]
MSLPFRFAVLSTLLAISAISLATEPVASVRVTFDRDGITAVEAHGLADIEAGRAVTVDDPVRIASVSKLIVAVGAMRLVEAGTLDLDADVSDLLGWPLRHPRFPDTPITLRQLLSHRASLTDAAGYYDVPLDGELRDIVRDPRAWDDGHVPGTYFRYANLGFPLVASAMENATGERFDRLMGRLVLQPLGIDACFNWESCSDATLAHAVVLYDGDRQPVRDDLRGRRPDCAVNRSSTGDCDLSHWRAGRNGALFSPQGGLRISASGLARIGRLLLGGGEIDGVRLLSPASVRTLTTPAWTYRPGNGQSVEEDDSSQSRRGFFCRYGLAVQTLATPHPDCGDDPFGDGIARIGHSGSAYGLLSGLWVDPAGGTGVAYFATGVPDAGRGAHSSFTAIEERLASGTARSAGKPDIETGDVTRFFETFDAAGGMPDAGQLQRGYLDPGTPGLREFVQGRIGSAQKLADSIGRKPELYAGARRCAAMLPGIRDDVARSLDKLRRVLPEARFPPVTIVVGRGNSGGTTTPSGVIIGLETLCSAEWLQPDLRARFAHLIAHEYAHIQQPGARIDAPPGTPLLYMALLEGGAELLGEIISGQVANVHLQRWTRGRECEIGREFVRDAGGADYSRWLYNGVGNEERPGDLGYWVGYRIAAAYHARSGDRHAALRRILDVTPATAGKLLRQSGWQPQCGDRRHVPAPTSAAPSSS